MVVGAGLGGLTAAIALRRAGVEVTVFERAARLEQVQGGGGLHLWPNAIRALKQLELEEPVRAAGMEFDRSVFETWRGARLADIPVGAVARDLGSACVAIRRARLHEVLLAALGREAVRTDATFTGYRQDPAGVIASFRDGREERADVLVGADGMRSAVRSRVLGEAKPHYVGYTSYIGAVDMASDGPRPDVLTVAFGRGSRFIYYNVDPRSVCWYGNVDAPEGGIDAHGRKAALRSVFAGWHPLVTRIIEATDESAITRMDLCDRAPAPRWGEGRVTLLGDAAHPMTPNIAQGCCQAIEDAVFLGKTLARAGDVPALLRGYEDVRRRRTAPIQKRARLIGAIGQWKNPIACRVRDEILFKRLSRFALSAERAMFAYDV